MDYSVRDVNKASYFRAIQHGMTGDYEEMVALVSAVLGESLGTLE